VCSFLLSDAHWAVETNLDKIIADAGNPYNITLPDNFVLERTEKPLFSEKEHLVLTGRVSAVKKRGCFFNEQSINCFFDYYIDLDEAPRGMSQKILITVNKHGVRSIKRFEVGDLVRVIYLPSKKVVVDIRDVRFSSHQWGQTRGFLMCVDMRNQLLNERG
jgi:hypothetical protein